MLDKNPDDRCTLREIRVHEWVTVEGSEPLRDVEYVRVTEGETSGTMHPARSSLTIDEHSDGSMYGTM